MDDTTTDDRDIHFVWLVVTNEIDEVTTDEPSNFQKSRNRLQDSSGRK